jgi:hypothetical protein
MRKTLLSTSGMMIAGLLSFAIVPAPAQATLISGTFSGMATDGADSADTLGLGAGVHEGDVLTGSFAFDDISVADNASSDNLTITINDLTTGDSSTYTDAKGSTYSVTDGNYSVTANGPDPNDIAAVLSFNSLSIVGADGLEQSFTSEDGSTGSLTGFDDSNLTFDITAADVEVIEPGSLSLIGMGLMGLVAARRRRAA